MKWCRVEFDKVVEVTELDPEGRFHPDFEWLACPADVTQGWEWTDGVFSAPELG